MKPNNTNNRLFNLSILFLIVITFIFFNFVFRTTLLVGFIFAVFTFPIHQFFTEHFPKFLGKNISSLSAVLTIIIVTLGLFGVGNYLGAQLAKEIPKFASSIYQNIQTLPENQGFLDKTQSFGISKEVVTTLVNQVESYVQPADGSNSSTDLFTQDNINKVVNVSQQAFGIIFNYITYFILFFLAWFNALVFGKRWLDGIFALIPMTKSEKTWVQKDLKFGIRNVIYANLLSGLIHTIATIIIMIIFGLPNIFIVSLIVFLLGFLPATPSELGYAIPVALIASTNPLAAVIVAIIAELIILWANYIFLPKIVLTGTEGNPLFIITSVLAGLTFFGLMGFIIAPVIMILINTLSQILLRRVAGEKVEEEIFSQ